MPSTNPLPEIKIIQRNDCQFMIMETDQIITGNLLHNGSFEQHLQVITEILIDDKSNGIVLDIGANLGTYSIPLAKRNKDLDFIGFEPQKNIYYQYCGNIFLNSLTNVKAFNFGIGSESKKISVRIPLYSSDNNIGAFSIDEETAQRNDECLISDEFETMVILTLDSLNIENIKLIKIDVEGMEKDVLLGGKETIIRNEYPPIIFETWTYKEWFQERRFELYKMLEDMGYEISIIGENNIAQHKTRNNYTFTISNNSINWTRNN